MNSDFLKVYQYVLEYELFERLLLSYIILLLHTFHFQIEHKLITKNVCIITVIKSLTNS